MSHFEFFLAPVHRYLLESAILLFKPYYRSGRCPGTLLQKSRNSISRLKMKILSWFLNLWHSFVEKKPNKHEFDHAEPFWNATKIGAMTAMLAQRVLDAISIDMVVRAPKRENQSGNAVFHARGRFPDIAQSEGRIWREVYIFSLARGRSHKGGSL